MNLNENSMKKLLSLPPNLVECFHEIEKVDRSEWFCTSDPVGSKLGSGGGTAWLLDACRREWAPELSLGEYRIFLCGDSGVWKQGKR